MALHRAEQIMVAVEANITGLATTGTNVFRGRIYALEESALPALSLYMGDDEKIGEYSQQLEDWELSINIGSHVAANDLLDTTLNSIRKEVVIALQANYMQGLPFVLNTEEGSASEPELGEGAVSTGYQLMKWTFKYRRSRIDPSA